MSNKRPRLSLRTLRKGMILAQVVARIDSEVVKERTFVESLRKRFFVSSEEAPDLAAVFYDRFLEFKLCHSSRVCSKLINERVGVS